MWYNRKRHLEDALRENRRLHASLNNARSSEDHWFKIADLLSKRVTDTESQLAHTQSQLEESETKRVANYEALIDARRELNQVYEELRLRDEKTESRAQSWAKGIAEFRRENNTL